MKIPVTKPAVESLTEAPTSTRVPLAKIRTRESEVATAMRRVTPARGETPVTFNSAL
ncbi:FxSxx-COOH cyclophane-containing RiPP peptide [Streptomyces humidus]|nr:FxSxx-COOH cyclophane-containing RiPP peptide [Streptomyces humidus]